MFCVWPLFGLSSWPDVWTRSVAVADLGAERDVRWTCAHHRRHDTASLALWFIEATPNAHSRFLNFNFYFVGFFFKLFHIHHSLALFLPPLSFLFGCEERSISLHDAGYQFFRSLSSWWHLAWLLYARQEMSWWWMKANCSLDPPFLHQALFASALSA